MKTVELETKAAGRYAYAAIQDARMRNIANASHYSDKQKLQAERMKLVLDFVYYNNGIYINYRKKGIVIKVDNAYIKDNVLLNEFENDWEKLNIRKSVSAQGVIYTVPAAEVL